MSAYYLEWIDSVVQAAYFPYVAGCVALLLLISIVCLILVVRRRNNIREIKELRGDSGGGGITGITYAPVFQNMTSGNTTIEQSGGDVLVLCRVQGGGTVARCWLSRAALLEMPGGMAVIGRAEGAHIRLTDMSVSRQHVYISWQAGGFCIQDAGSTAGIVLNGKRISPDVKMPVNHGDQLKIGDVQLVLELTDRGGN